MLNEKLKNYVYVLIAIYKVSSFGFKESVSVISRGQCPIYDGTILTSDCSSSRESSVCKCFKQLLNRSEQGFQRTKRFAKKCENFRSHFANFFAKQIEAKFREKSKKFCIFRKRTKCDFQTFESKIFFCHFQKVQKGRPQFVNPVNKKVNSFFLFMSIGTPCTKNIKADVNIGES